MIRCVDGSGEDDCEASLTCLLRPIGIDEWSEVRHVHAAALVRLTGAEPGTREHGACHAFVYDPDYTDDLMDEDLWGIWLDGRLAGTAGWRPADDRGSAARITSVYVDPLFARLGLGRRLVEDAQRRAFAAGFRVFNTRATALSAAFFERLGYEISSYGVHALSGDLGFPVVFMRRGDPVVPVRAREGATAGLNRRAPEPFAPTDR